MPPQPQQHSVKQAKILTTLWMRVPSKRFLRRKHIGTQQHRRNWTKFNHHLLFQDQAGGSALQWQLAHLRGDLGQIGLFGAYLTLIATVTKSFLNIHPCFQQHWLHIPKSNGILTMTYFKFNNMSILYLQNLLTYIPFLNVLHFHNCYFNFSYTTVQSFSHRLFNICVSF